MDILGLLAWLAGTVSWSASAPEPTAVNVRHRMQWSGAGEQRFRPVFD
jgi:hypothetical protein